MEAAWPSGQRGWICPRKSLVQLLLVILLEVISTVCFIGPEKPLRGIGQSSKLSHLRADSSHILTF